MRFFGLTGCFFLITLSSAIGLPSGKQVELSPHRAVYDLSLDGQNAGGTRAIEQASGRIVFDFLGNDCEGYTLSYRQVTVMQSGEGGAQTSDLRNTTFESGQGDFFRFRTESVLNGSAKETVTGEARQKTDQTQLVVKNLPQPLQVKGNALFPSQHMKKLIVAALKGENVLETSVFDGGEDGTQVYETLAVIGKRQEASRSKQKNLVGKDFWPVSISYFKKADGERLPVYILSFDLYDNGISGDLKLDYGSLKLKGSLSKLDVYPVKECR